MSLQSIIESLLFVSGEPVKIKKLVKITGALKPEVENALMLIGADFKNRGFRLIKNSNEAQIVTAPENSKFVNKLIKSDTRENLSEASLETLAVIAYRGPATRAQIENIRGVNCSFILRNLLIRGLVERMDNLKDSRSYLYKITFDFMKKMGIEKIEDLPKYQDLKI